MYQVHLTDSYFPAQAEDVVRETTVGGVLRAQADVSESELLAWMEGKVARYKLPKRVFFWDALPKSGYGKVPKRLVRDELEARGLLGSTDGAPA